MIIYKVDFIYVGSIIRGMISKANLKTVLADWNLWGGFEAEYKPRTSLMEKVWPSLEQRAFVTVLTGVRRSGKSSLGLMLLQRFGQEVSPNNTLYLNLEDPRLVEDLSLELLQRVWEVFEEEISDDEETPKLVFIDEIQLVPRWERFVRSLLDRKVKAKLIISGSSAQLLSGELASALTGRSLSYEVFPLSLSEFEEFLGVKSQKERKRCFYQYLERGGFPEVVLTANKSLQKQILSGLFSDILNKDILNRYQVKNRQGLLKFAYRVINQNTSYVSAYEADKSLAISLPTALEYLGYLEESYLVSFLQRFSLSLKRQTRYPRKVMAVDPGLYNQLAFVRNHWEGVALENAVFVHLRRQTREIWYWSNKEHEVDLVAQLGGEVIPINVSYAIEGPRVREREEGGLMAMMEEFDLPKAMLIVQEGEVPDVKRVGKRVIEYVSAKEWLRGGI